jgi:TPR repeat protein
MWERYTLVSLLWAQKKIKEELAEQVVNSLEWCQKRAQLAEVQYYIYDKAQYSHPDVAVTYLYSSMKAGFNRANKRFSAGGNNLEILPKNAAINLEELSVAELFKLGVASYTFMGRTEDKALAFRCFERIASLEPFNLEMQNNLGVLLFNGIGVVENIPEALKYYRFAATQGNAEAQYNLAGLYAWGVSGEGIPRDESEAKKWYRLAAVQGNGAAQKSLGCLLMKNKSNAEEVEEGLVWGHRAAEQGNIEALNFLKGFYYEKTERHEMEYSDWMKWDKKIAMQGEKGNASTLGEKYMVGRGVPKNKEEAIKWFRVALKYGDKVDESLSPLMSDAPSFEVRYHYSLCKYRNQKKIVRLVKEDRENFLQLLREDNILQQENLFKVVQFISEVSSQEELGQLLTEYLPQLTFSQMMKLFQSVVNLNKCYFEEEKPEQDPVMDIGLALFDVLMRDKLIIREELISAVERDAFNTMIYFTVSLFLNSARESQNSLRRNFACVYIKLLLISFFQISPECVVNDIKDIEHLIEKSEMTERLTPFTFRH